MVCDGETRHYANTGVKTRVCEFCKEDLRASDEEAFSGYIDPSTLVRWLRQASKEQFVAFLTQTCFAFADTDNAVDHAVRVLARRHAVRLADYGF
jgi:hypothetical protein